MAKTDWFQYRKVIGNRTALFSLVADRWQIRNALYLGSYADLSPSMVWEHVTYVDQDNRANEFFTDRDLVYQQLNDRRYPENPVVTFIHGDFNSDLVFKDGVFDLVISLYSGPSLAAALRFLAPGGLLIVNNSHADASLGLLEETLRPAGCIVETSSGFSLIETEIQDYFAFKYPEKVTEQGLLTSGKGAKLKKSSFALIFTSKAR